MQTLNSLVASATSRVQEATAPAVRSTRNFIARHDMKLTLVMAALGSISGPRFVRNHGIDSPLRSVLHWLTLRSLGPASTAVTTQSDPAGSLSLDPSASQQSSREVAMVPDPALPGLDNELAGLVDEANEYWQNTIDFVSTVQSANQTVANALVSANARSIIASEIIAEYGQQDPSSPAQPWDIRPSVRAFEADLDDTPTADVRAAIEATSGPIGDAGNDFIATINTRIGAITSGLENAVGSTSGTDQEKIQNTLDTWREQVVNPWENSEGSSNRDRIQVIIDALPESTQDIAENLNSGVTGRARSLESTLGSRSSFGSIPHRVSEAQRRTDEAAAVVQSSASELASVDGPALADAAETISEKAVAVQTSRGDAIENARAGLGTLDSTVRGEIADINSDTKDQKQTNEDNLEEEVNESIAYTVSTTVGDIIVGLTFFAISGFASKKFFDAVGGSDADVVEKERGIAVAQYDADAAARQDTVVTTLGGAKRDRTATRYSNRATTVTEALDQNHQHRDQQVAEVTTRNFLHL